MLIVWLILAIFGVIRYRHFSYWRWVLYAFFLSGLFDALFSGRGTAVDPAGDGLVTYFVRQATSDGPAMGIMALVIVPVFWVCFISLLVKAFRTGRQLTASQMEMQTAGNLVKSAEIVVLVLVVLLGQILSRMPPWEIDEHLFGNTDTTALQSIEDELAKVAVAINLKAPTVIDAKTTLTRATINGREFTYHYTIDIASEDVDNVRQFVEPNVLLGQCKKDGAARSDIQNFGIVYSYQYTSLRGSFLFKISVNEDACLKAGL